MCFQDMLAHSQSLSTSLAQYPSLVFSELQNILSTPSVPLVFLLSLFWYSSFILISLFDASFIIKGPVAISYSHQFQSILFSTELFNDSEIVQRLGLSNLNLRYFLRCVFEVKGEVALNLADVSRENVRHHGNRVKHLSQFFSLIQEVVSMKQ